MRTRTMLRALIEALRVARQTIRKAHEQPPCSHCHLAFFSADHFMIDNETWAEVCTRIGVPTASYIHYRCCERILDRLLPNAITEAPINQTHKDIAFSMLGLAFGDKPPADPPCRCGYYEPNGMDFHAAHCPRTGIAVTEPESQDSSVPLVHGRHGDADTKSKRYVAVACEQIASFERGRVHTCERCGDRVGACWCWEIA